MIRFEKLISTIKTMTPEEKERLKQCVRCENTPNSCGCSEKDEDENGFCNRYKERKRTNENKDARDV